MNDEYGIFCSSDRVQMCGKIGQIPNSATKTQRHEEAQRDAKTKAQKFKAEKHARFSRLTQLNTKNSTLKTALPSKLHDVRPEDLHRDRQQYHPEEFPYNQQPVRPQRPFDPFQRTEHQEDHHAVDKDTN